MPSGCGLRFEGFFWYPTNLARYVVRRIKAAGECAPDRSPACNKDSPGDSPICRPPAVRWNSRSSEINPCRHSRFDHIMVISYSSVVRTILGRSHEGAELMFLSRTYTRAAPT